MILAYEKECEEGLAEYVLVMLPYSCAFKCLLVFSVVHLS